MHSITPEDDAPHSSQGTVLLYIRCTFVKVEEIMRTILSAVSLAAGFGLMLCQSASALPVNAGAIGLSASGVSPVEHAQFYERHTRHGLVKCYRELVIGRYVCRRVY
jgi:hypothetical protein